jgi:dienelactone hydrolase
MRRYSLVILMLLTDLILSPAYADRPPAGALDRLFGAGVKAQGPAETFHAADRPIDTDGVAARSAEWLRAFAAKREPFEYTKQFVREEDGINVYRMTFPSPLETRWPENNVVPAEYFTPAGASAATGKLPAAIFLDIKAGNAIVPRMLARAAARQGMAAIYVPMPGYGARRPAGDYQRALDDDPKLVVESIRQTVMDVRRAKAILAARPEVDANRVGICGVSLGGIMAALAAGVDGSFDRVVLILAGGDLATIAFNENRETRRLRAALIANGLDPASAATLFAPVEPLNFAARIGAGRCLMINALNDEIIPRATTDALRAAIGEPTVVWLPAGHYSIATHFLTIQRRAMEFLSRQAVAAPSSADGIPTNETADEPAR